MLLSKTTMWNLASYVRRPFQQYNIYPVIHLHARRDHQNTSFTLWKDLLKTPDVMYDFLYNL